MPSFPVGSHEQAQAWERRGHLLHFERQPRTWECWAHGPEDCDAVQGGKLQEAPADQ